jgi:hypothetical protein
LETPTSSDPRKFLPSAAGSYVERSLVSMAGQDAAEALLESVIAQFPPRVPAVHELNETPNLPWVLAGQQQIISALYQVLHNYRRERSNVSS